MFAIFYSMAAGFVAFFSSFAAAQPNLAGETEIRQRLNGLRTLGSVMMIAAHPDDENTALLAYFARGRHMRTAYLSLTRGEGGQNLIGSQQGDALGLIRTEELLAARRIDGAEQYFTRAIDFGFSKNLEDTFAHWPREQVLGDVVWNIRRFRPDVIVLRFSGTPRDGHGHHQASAILGKEAFSAAADPSRFPEQLKYVQLWQAKRLMYNVLSFTADQEKEAKGMADRVEIDIGAYDPELGYSYGEIAGMSRSQHRSQGMGAPQQKGSIKNYLVTIAGDKATKDVFDAIDTTWTRLPGGAGIGSRLDDARERFDPRHPEALVQPLAELRPLIAAIHSSIAEGKLHDLDEAIVDCAGLWLNAAADRATVAPGASLKVNLTALDRLPAHVLLTGIRIEGAGSPDVSALDVARAVLIDNQPSRYAHAVSVPASELYSQPYWLVEPKQGWLYAVPDPREIGDPENPPVLQAHFEVTIAGAELDLARPVEYRYVDPIYGELTRPLAIVPPIAIDPSVLPLVFPTTRSRTIDVPIRSSAGKSAIDVHLEAPAGWQIEPAERHFDLASGQQTTASFEITPPSSGPAASLGPETDAPSELHVVATVGDRKVSVATQILDFPHIPIQLLFPAAETRVVRADIRTLAHNIGYVMGAGDEEPDAIRQMGAQVTLLTPANLASGDLTPFDAIVTGVRAWNTRPDVRANAQRLFDYVRTGGALIVQYNVLDAGPFGGDASMLENIGPLAITISRDRVTDENAPVTFPDPRNPLLHSPNEITARDFEGWVQERGLYFASEWDLRYRSVLESHDPGEEPHPGGELYLRDGKGVYIFSAYSWFRELPAGVAGAYRLFANMLSAAKTQ
jgi:LmbE family N-acetylglucosaminyl deacetylase